MWYLSHKEYSLDLPKEKTSSRHKCKWTEGFFVINLVFPCPCFAIFIRKAPEESANSNGQYFHWLHMGSKITEVLCFGFFFFFFFHGSWWLSLCHSLYLHSQFNVNGMTWNTAGKNVMGCDMLDYLKQHFANYD